MLVRFVTQRSDKAADAWATTPQYAVDGAVLFQANDCGSCHKINGVGDDLGPPLNAVGERRSRQWITDHFKAPSKLVANSLMPPFQFKVRDLKLITDYIMSIP